jgi:hypothetical protein
MGQWVEGRNQPADRPARGSFDALAPQGFGPGVCVAEQGASRKRASGTTVSLTSDSFSRAESAVYLAKGNARNRVVTENELGRRLEVS